MQEIGSLFANINAMAVTPFKQQLPLAPVALLFVLVLIIALQWRWIVDSIEEIAG